MKTIFVVTLVFVFVLLMFGQARVNLTKEQTNPDLFCGEAVEGLQLCTSSESIKVKHGNSVELDVILKNLTDADVSVKPSSAFDTGLLMSITDENGEKVPTILESLNKIKEQRELTSDESAKQFQYCCLNRAGFKGQPTLSKGEAFKSRQVINDYDLSRKGTYFVDIGRRVANSNGEGDVEVWLRHIEVKVK